MAVEVGSVVEGKVVSVMPFGAFVELEGGTNGLVHISEISTEYVQSVADHLKIGDVVKAKVVKIDESGKISLSIKKRMLDEQKQNRKPRSGGPRPTGGAVRPADVDSLKSDNSALSFEDLMAKFKSDSDEKQQALRRSSDSKLRSGYKRF